jgi:hypothetical protein
MALETATHIDDLVITNPDGADDLNQGDDHIKMIKDVLKRDLPLTTPATTKGMALLTTSTASAIRSLLGIQETSNRNRVINGDFTVDQRNSGATVALVPGAALVYTVDRFFAYCTGLAVNVKQSDNFSGTGKVLGVSGGNASQTGVGIGTRLPQLITRDMSGQACTLSVKLTASVPKTVTWAVYEANTTDSFGTIAAPTKTLRATGTFAATATETQFAANFTLTSGVAGLEILFTVTSMLLAETLDIANLQFELGTVASSDITFESVNPLIQLQRCQQYYCTTNCTARTYASGAVETASAPIYLPVQMRAIPTASYITATGSTTNATSESITGITKQAARFDITSVAAGDCYAVDRTYSFTSEL